MAPGHQHCGCPCFPEGTGDLPKVTQLVGCELRAVFGASRQSPPGSQEPGCQQPVLHQHPSLPSRAALHKLLCLSVLSHLSLRPPARPPQVPPRSRALSVLSLWRVPGAARTLPRDPHVHHLPHCGPVPTPSYYLTSAVPAGPQPDRPPPMCPEPRLDPCLWLPGTKAPCLPPDSSSSPGTRGFYLHPLASQRPHLDLGGHCLNPSVVSPAPSAKPSPATCSLGVVDVLTFCSPAPGDKGLARHCGLCLHQGGG